MSVVKRKRKESPFEVFHHLTKMRKDITDLLLRDFGYSNEKFQKKMEKWYGGKPPDQLTDVQKRNIERQRRRAEVALKKYLFTRMDSDPALFVSDRNPHGRIKKTGIEKIIRDIGARSGIGRRVYPHLIRHTTATDSLERGMNVVELQKILGHEKLDTTMIYAKVCQENVKYNHHRYVV